MSIDDNGVSNINSKWLICAFSIVGLLVGFLLGGSNSPVVSIALPLIFALLSGISGAYLSRIDVNSEISAIRINLISKCTVGFVLGCFVGVYFGYSFRFPEQNDKSINIYKYTKNSKFLAEDLIELALLQRKLTLANINKKDIDLIVKNAVNNYKYPSAQTLPPVEIVEEITNDISKLYDHIIAFRKYYGTFDPDTTGKHSTTYAFEQLLRNISETKNVLSKSKELPAFRVNRIVNEMGSVLDGGFPTRVLLAAEGCDFDYKYIVNVKNDISKYKSHVPPNLVWPISYQKQKSLDQDIRLLSNVNRDAEEPLFEMK